MADPNDYIQYHVQIGPTAEMPLAAFEAELARLRCGPLQAMAEVIDLREFNPDRFFYIEGHLRVFVRALLLKVMNDSDQDVVRSVGNLLEFIFLGGKVSIASLSIEDVAIIRSSIPAFAAYVDFEMYSDDVESEGAEIAKAEMKFALAVARKRLDCLVPESQHVDSGLTQLIVERKTTHAPNSESSLYDESKSLFSLSTSFGCC